MPLQFASLPRQTCRREEAPAQRFFFFFFFRRYGAPFKIIAQVALV